MAGPGEALIDAAMKYYATLIDSACVRWKSAASEIDAGTYTTAKLASDWIGGWMEAGATYWASALGVLGPHTSYIWMRIPATTTTPSTMPLPVTYAAAPKVTDLTQIAGSTVLTTTSGAVAIAAGAGTGAYDLVVTLPASTPTGVYLGVAYGVATPVFVYVEVY